jgi:hypothetical protein
MGRRSRRQRAKQVFDTLSPEQVAAVMVVGMINGLVAMVLDIALAVVLTRSARQSWRERQRGPVVALRAGLSPALIGLVGALAVHEVVRAVVIRVVIRPAPGGSASNPPPEPPVRDAL